MIATKRGEILRIGWLQDPSDYLGGAELESRLVRQRAPEWVEIVQCPPGEIVADVDLYIVQNCTRYGHEAMFTLEHRPVIKRVHDMYTNGNGTLRRWMLDNALLMMSSPLHVARFPWQYSGQVVLCPSAIDVPAIRAAASQNGFKKSPFLWLGRFWPGKGLENLEEWAAIENVEVDVYGFGPLVEVVKAYPHLNFCGEVAPEDVADIMRRYETFVFLPSGVEPYSRTVVEAWVAGMFIKTNGNVGATWWLQTSPGAITQGATYFWNLVREYVNGL